MNTFSAGAKTVEVYPAAGPGRPVIYLHTFSGEGAQVYQALQSTGCPDFSLVTVSGLDWNHDMAPWDCPPVFRGGAPCTGGAGDHLRLLCQTILPRAEQMLLQPVSRRGIAGYSLAGLFAVYALYQTGVFAGAASVSGSLWFPGFRAYALSHAFCRKPHRLYFSLGKKECKTRNSYMQHVQEDTEAIVSSCRARGIETAFLLNPGSHFQNAVPRMADGIRWLLAAEEMPPGSAVV